MHNPTVKTAKFKADSALLRELGERLVGQPHIALAELVKNAYDADATCCKVDIDADEITVTDNGHGMSESEFCEHWMSIGTRNKQRQARSRHLGRHLTGSKGVGRLSAQFLAHQLEITTASKTDPGSWLIAEVDWDEAIEAGNLTEAEARYRIQPPNSRFPRNKRCGTRISMSRLKQPWPPDAIRDLGRQLWMIQPPISWHGSLTSDGNYSSDFEVELRSSLPELEDAFDTQMRAALDNHIAIVTGELERDQDGLNAHVQVAFQSGERYSEHFTFDEPLIASAKWEIRIFNLAGRQGGGVKVQTAREYFERFGGVHVYDAGFHLPYYGVEQDWLRIEYDHSHRRNRSALLPDRLRVPRALNDLPTQGRLFGVVEIDTGKEARSASRRQRQQGEYLKIQVTRDRLVANQAYDLLCRAVRWSLDYYATRQRLREQERVVSVGMVERPTDVVERVRVLATEAKASYPHDETISALEEQCKLLATSISKHREADNAARALLAPLASAGMAALALEHETRKETQRARNLLKRLWRAAQKAGDNKIRRLTEDLVSWIDRIEHSRRLFAPLLDTDDREKVDTLSAKAVLTEVLENTSPIVQGMVVDIDIPGDIYLPPATFAEWNSLFQNVLINAANATLDFENGRASCVGGKTARSTWLRLHDNGIGLDLHEADQLFEPFSRRLQISEERRRLALGGMGMGLTIVRMIAERRNVKVRFITPPPPWSTTFQLSWST